MASKEMFIMKRNLFPTGGSMAVRLPVEFVDALGLKEGQEVSVCLMEGRKGKFIAVY